MIVEDVTVQPLDTEVVLKWFAKYPDLEKFIGAGTISLKMSREILGVDRWFMYDMYLELVKAGAVAPSGCNGYRATKPMQAFLSERRAKARSSSEVT